MIRVELWEVSFGHTALAFTLQSDALAAAGALAKGALVGGAANPLHPERTISLTPVECSVRRVFLPATVRKCIAAYGKRLPTVQAGSALPELPEPKRLSLSVWREKSGAGQ